MKRTIVITTIAFCMVAFSSNITASSTQKVKKRKAKTTKVKTTTKSKSTTSTNNSYYSTPSNNPQSSTYKSDASSRSSSSQSSNEITHNTASNSSSFNDGKYYHVVEKGETMQFIANLYGVSLKDIIVWNNLADNNIRVGDKLWIKTMDAEPQQSNNYDYEFQDNYINNDNSTFTHTVARGETLASIAQTYGVTVKDLILWNNLNDDTLRPGTQLRIMTMSENYSSVPYKDLSQIQKITEEEQEEAHAEKTWGTWVKIGVGNYAGKGAGKFFKESWLMSMQIGAKYYAIKNLPISAGLGWFASSIGGYGQGIETEQWDIQLPLRVGYEPLADNFQIGIHAGPIFSYAITGSGKYMGEKIKWSEMKKNIDVFDVQANVLLTIGIGNFRLFGEFIYSIIREEKYWMIGIAFGL